MTALTRLALRFRTVTLLLVVLLVAAGSLSVLRLNQELFPSFDVPYMVVTAVQPGAGPAQVSEGLAVPLEKALQSTQGLRHVSSTSLEGMTIVSGEFEFGVDMVERERDVRDKIAALTLPEGVATPTVQRISLDSFPVLSMSVSGADAQATEAFVDGKLIPALSTTEGVARANKAGGSQKLVAVVVDPTKLAAAGLGTTDVTQALTSANLSTPVGGVIDNGVQFPVRVANSPTTLDDVKAVPVLPSRPSAGAAPVALGEVAEVTLSEAGAGTTISRTDGKPSISVDIVKEQDANTVNTVDAVNEAIAGLEVPAGVTVETVTDQAPQIRHAVSDLARDALIGGVLAVIMILVFLRSLRSTIVAGISIPLSLLVAFVLMSADHISLNILTLGALSVAAGRVIDDAIVVIENIHRLLEQGEERDDAVLQGTSQMVPAITASTITTVAVFLPLAFVGGLVGQVFVGFALTVTFALLASLLVAVTVVPVMAQTFLRTRDLDKGEHEQSRLRTIYHRPLVWALGHRAIIVAGAVVLLVLSLASLSRVPTNIFPAGAVETLNVSLVGKPGTSLAAMSDQVAGFEKHLEGLAGVRRYTTVVGTSADATSALRGGGGGASSATVTLALDPGADDKAITAEVERLIPAAGLAGAVSGGSDFGGGSNLAVQITGDDFAAVSSTARSLGESIGKLDGLKNVRTNVTGERPEVQVVVDETKAAARGLTPKTVAGLLRSSLTPAPATTVTLDGTPRQVTVSVDPRATAGAEALGKLPLAPGLVLSDIATVTQGSSPTGVTRYDGERSAQIQGVITSSNAGKVNQDVQAAINGTTVPAGVTVSLGGAAEMQSESFAALGLAMLLAVFLVYLAMVTAFGSLLTPFVILLTLPLAMIGAFPALAVTGRELGLPAMLGLLMLIGIVVTNAIVMLELVERLEKEGLSTYDAIVQGAETRLRPILMTALVTVLALTPLALGLSEGALLSSSLATVVIGGLLSSTLLTLVVIPCVYSLFAGLRRRLSRTPATPRSGEGSDGPGGDGGLDRNGRISGDGTELVPTT
jgi:HAE1 family hydrophobic/amphiphilic exporter-1